MDEMPPASYVQREEERQLRQLAASVGAEGKSRAVLLYGPGGVGKTWLLRRLVQSGATDPRTIWLDPVDVDDAEYWLQSNLERMIADRLEPDGEYFQPYRDRLSRLSWYAQPHIGHDTVVSHLAQMRNVFVDCYSNFVQQRDPERAKTVVITLDTVEAVRGMPLLLVSLTQLMKALPRTLFILACRPMPGDGEDPVKHELQDPHRSLEVAEIPLSEFSWPAALSYLDRSAVATALTDEEKEKLVHLTRGHPLWMALAVEYLATVGMPEEAEGGLDEIRLELPYRDEMTAAGRVLHEAFRRRLVTPYRANDFWHEATKRLAVVRQSVNRSIWQQLMEDSQLPDDVADWEEAWDRLLDTGWIRPRANRRFVTLHDALAEELAELIIPLHDLDGSWRHRQWRRAIEIYSALIEREEQRLTRDLAALDDALRAAVAELPADEATAAELPTEEPTTRIEAGFIEVATQLDAQKRELDQLKAARLYHQLLHDPKEGSRQFLTLFEQARRQHDILFQHLIALEMQRFLPSEGHAYALSDVIGRAIASFQAWLFSEPRTYIEVGLSMADFLIRNEQPKAAFELLDRLPLDEADAGQRYRLNIQRGNACMRIPGRVKLGEQYFLDAYNEAVELQSPGQERRTAKALKELGFYYRNEGLWRQADEAYQRARDAILLTLSARSSHEDREEMASIQTNWAYVKALQGDYREAENLVESAISVRRRLRLRQEEGASLSVCGEVYRYDRQFQKAWTSYKEAERIFDELRNWSWLGLIYQEQAICLLQAAKEGTRLEPDPFGEARRRIELSLDICRDQAVRGYPSALNRAGRIFGQDDPQAGLELLKEGINQARRLSDGWFWFANLVEYVELSYFAWLQADPEHRQEYRNQIAARASEIEEAMADYTFPDLEGRWRLLQGHLAVHDALATGDESSLDTALQHYKRGFALIARGYVGSHGTAAIPSEFKRFRELFRRLRPETRAVWQDELRSAWSELGEGSTSLLARLEELY